MKYDSILGVALGSVAIAGTIAVGIINLVDEIEASKEEKTLPEQQK